MPRIGAACRGNTKTENCTAVLFCFTTVSLPAFAGDVLRQIIVRASLECGGHEKQVFTPEFSKTGEDLPHGSGKVLP